MAKNKKLTQKTSNKPIKISQTLVVKPPQRPKVGIERLKSALHQADRGYRAPLIELINELRSSDPVLEEAWDKRVRAITNSDIVFQIEGKEVEAMMDMIDTTEFEDFLIETMLTLGLGKTVIETDFSTGTPKFTSIDRRHLQTERKEILINSYDTTGVSYENDDFLLNLGKDKDLGIFLRVIPYAIFKRDGFGDYAQYAELFGMPDLIALYDPEDDNARQEMEEAVSRRGSAGSMVMSKNGDVKTVGAEAAGTNTIHKDFLKTCDEQILIGIIGQTMTTKDGSSYSQGKVHGDTENDINKADRRFVQRVLNEKLLPLLEKRGYPVKGGWFSFVEKEKALAKTEQLTIAMEVDDRTEEGVDSKYWFENFGLPKGNRKAKKETVEKPEEEKDDEVPGESKKENAKKTATGSTHSKKVKALELSFWNKLKDFFALAPR